MLVFSLKYRTVAVPTNQHPIRQQQQKRHPILEPRTTDGGPDRIRGDREVRNRVVDGVYGTGRNRCHHAIVAVPFRSLFTATEANTTEKKEQVKRLLRSFPSHPVVCFGPRRRTQRNKTKRRRSSSYRNDPRRPLIIINRQP